MRLSEVISPALSLHLTGTYIFLPSYAARCARLSELISPALALHRTGTNICLGSFAARWLHLSELTSPTLSLHLTCTYIFLGSFAARCASLNLIYPFLSLASPHWHFYISTEIRCAMPLSEGSNLWRSFPRSTSLALIYFYRATLRDARASLK